MVMNSRQQVDKEKGVRGVAKCLHLHPFKQSPARTPQGLFDGEKHQALRSLGSARTLGMEIETRRTAAMHLVETLPRQLDFSQETGRK